MRPMLYRCHTHPSSRCCGKTVWQQKPEDRTHRCPYKSRRTHILPVCQCASAPAQAPLGATYKCVACKHRRVVRQKCPGFFDFQMHQKKPVRDKLRYFSGFRMHTSLTAIGRLERQEAKGGGGGVSPYHTYQWQRSRMASRPGMAERKETAKSRQLLLCLLLQRMLCGGNWSGLGG